MRLRWFRATTAGAPFVYVEAYSKEEALAEAREHYLYHNAKWIEVRFAGYNEVQQYINGRG